MNLVDNRQRAKGSLALWTGQTSTFPPLKNRYLNSFTFAAHISQGGDDIVEVVEGLIKLDAMDVIVT